jgi:hypothetical protein
MKLFRWSTFAFIVFLLCLRYLVSEDISLNWDAPIFIQGSYLVYLNQIPNVDFSTPLGPVMFLIGGLGMKLTTPTIIGMNVGMIIFSTIVLIATFFYSKIFYRKGLIYF